MVKEYILYDSKINIEAHGDNACVSFITDVQSFAINYAISDVKKGNFPHVGITAREGLAVFYRRCMGELKDNCFDAWMPVELLARDYHTVVNMSHIICKPEIYEIIIYGPILAHLLSLSVEIDEKGYFHTKESDNGLKRVLFLGGGKTYGLGVTSTAMMFSNIIRRHGVAVDRISYTQSNYIDLIHNALCNAKDISLYDTIVLETDSRGQSKEAVACYLEKVLEKIDKCRHIIIWHSSVDTDREKKKLVKRIINKWIELRNYVYLDLDFIFDEDFVDMCTYSVKYLNNAGNVKIYYSIIQEMEKYLWNI